MGPICLLCPCKLTINALVVWFEFDLQRFCCFLFRALRCMCKSCGRRAQGPRQNQQGHNTTNTTQPSCAGNREDETPAGESAGQEGRPQSHELDAEPEQVPGGRCWQRVPQNRPVDPQPTQGYTCLDPGTSRMSCAPHPTWLQPQGPLAGSRLISSLRLLEIDLFVCHL